MRTMFYAATAATVLAVIALFALPSGAAPAGYKLVWSDEFNGPIGSEPSAAIWNYDNGRGYNNELEINDVTQADCHIVEDPSANDHRALQITATPMGNGRYSSVRLNTRGNYSVQYGYIEARMKIPEGQGMWPAFWMLGNSQGWPACGEIDIMENIGKTPGTVYGSIHGPGYVGHKVTNAFTLPNNASLGSGYHTYGVNWEPGKLVFYLDGKPYATDTTASIPTGTTWAFDSQPFYIILNLAIGGDWPGNPDASTVFPAHLMVDYVRVYKAPT